VYASGEGGTAAETNDVICRAREIPHTQTCIYIYILLYTRTCKEIIIKSRENEKRRRGKKVTESSWPGRVWTTTRKCCFNWKQKPCTRYRLTRRVTSIVRDAGNAYFSHVRAHVARLTRTCRQGHVSRTAPTRHRIRGKGRSRNALFATRTTTLSAAFPGLLNVFRGEPLLESGRRPRRGGCYRSARARVRNLVGVYTCTSIFIFSSPEKVVDRR